MCGYLRKEEKEEWAQRNRQAQVDSAEAWKKEQEAKNGGTKIVRSTRASAGRNGFVDYTAPPKARPGSPPQAGRDLTKCSPTERDAHQRAMLEAHKERFKDAHWTQTIPIIEAAQKEDILAESVGHRLHGANKKFVMAPQQISVSIAPKDVDNHLFTGAVHKEAESEQEIIARKVENHQLEINDHKGREKMKDEMDALRRQRTSTWTDSAIPTSSDSEVAL